MNKIFTIGYGQYIIYSYEKNIIPQILLDKVKPIINEQLKKLQQDIEKINIQRNTLNGYKKQCELSELTNYNKTFQLNEKETEYIDL